MADTYHDRYFRPRRLEAGSLLEKGVQLGELKKNIDIDICIDLIYGPIFYRLLVTGEPLDESYVQQLIVNAFEGIRTI